MKAVLIPLNGGSRFDVGPDFVVVGRGASCEVQLVDKSVSNDHCVMVVKDGLLIIRDLNSSNGTYFNEQRVLRAVAKSGDRISIGTVLFRVELTHPYRQADAIRFEEASADDRGSNTAKVENLPKSLDYENVLNTETGETLDFEVPESP